VTEEAPTRTFPGYGRCIYCARTKNLSDEHVVPLALRGVGVIEKGSCDECAKETSASEGYLAGKFFNYLRGNTFPSRKPRQRPKTRRVTVEHEGIETTLDVPYGEEPPTPLFFPMLPPAGILRGDEPRASSVVPMKMVLPGVPNLAERLDRLKPGEGAKVKLEYTFEFGQLFRLLAKIAHCTCVLDLGLDGFAHILPKYILGKDDRYPYVIGGQVSRLSLQPTRGGHHAEVHLINAHGRTYSTVIIQLLSGIGFPFYEVVAGELSAEAARAAWARAAKLGREGHKYT
jgi:hypothetical protein